MDSTPTPPTQDAGTPRSLSRPVQTPRLAADRILPPLTRRQAWIEVLLVLFVLFYPHVFLRLAITDTSTITMGSELGARVYLLAVSQGMVALVLIAFVVYKGGYSWKTLGVVRRSLPGDVLAAAVALAATYVLIAVIPMLIRLFRPALFAQTIKDRTELMDMFVPIHPVLLIGFCLFVGIYEELLFRGLILTRLRVVCGGWTLAIIVSSLGFGLAHLYQGHVAVLQIVCVAAVLSVLFVVRGGIVAPIITHALFNFINLCIMPHLAHWAHEHKDMLDEFIKSTQN